MPSKSTLLYSTILSLIVKSEYSLEIVFYDLDYWFRFLRPLFVLQQQIGTWGMPPRRKFGWPLRALLTFRLPLRNVPSFDSLLFAQSTRRLGLRPPALYLPLSNLSSAAKSLLFPFAQQSFEIFHPNYLIVMLL